MAEGKTYQSQNIDITFDVKRCVHSRKCTLSLPSVFDVNAMPWIEPVEGNTEAIAAMIETCPSGALTYDRKDGGEQEAVPAVNFVRLWEHGPLEVRGSMKMAGQSIGYRATLCRCGASKNKPYCDNSHIDMGFKATGEAKPRDVEDEDLPPGGDLVLEPLKDGPLHVAGNLETIAGSGRHIASTSDTYFCRCGASANKPYCDGSHRRIEFQADGA